MIRESTLALEGPLLVSKWIKLALLIDVHEMEHFFNSLPSSFRFYHVQGVCEKGRGIDSSTDFINGYKEYIDCLKRGEAPCYDRFKLAFAPALSLSSDAFYAISVSDTHWLIKGCLPIVQLQANQIRYSKEEDLFRGQVYGNDCISWGISIGFPHLYQNPHTHEISTTKDFPNATLFREIQSWIRQNTLPTPFIVNGKKRNEPIRLGKSCFEWIHLHRGLKEANIQVVTK